MLTITPTMRLLKMHESHKSTNKTGLHNITEILLKVALKTITPNLYILTISLLTKFLFHNYCTVVKLFSMNVVLENQKLHTMLLFDVFRERIQNTRYKTICLT